MNTRESTNKMTMPYIILGAIFLIIGLIGVIFVLFKGHEAAYGVTREVPWGLLIGTYAYFVIISTGLAFIGGLAHTFGIRSFENIGKRIVFLAFFTLLAGFTQIGMELGHPFRLMIYFLLSPNFKAPIVWMGIFYSIELVILAFELYMVFFPKKFSHTHFKIIGFLALFVGVLATSNLGFVFGSINARPFYHGIYFPIFLVVTGIGGGCALLLVVHNLLYKFSIPLRQRESMYALGKLMGICITFAALMVFWKIVSSLFTEPKGAYEAVLTLLFGKFSVNFWLGEVVLTYLLPILLIVLSKANNVKFISIAGFSYLIGLFFTRYDFIVAGQLPLMREPHWGSGVKALNGLAVYSPSAIEIAVFCLAIGIFTTLYFLSERYLYNYLENSH